MIQVSELSKVYRSRFRRSLALDGLSFEVQPGQIYGLLGPNGAGKTTTLRLLATLLVPTSGTASVAGFDIVTQPEDVRRNIGFISASTGVYDRMTAWELVAHFGRLHGMPEELLVERIERLFERLRMNDFRKTYGSQMSTGMKQKVSIARALVHDPPVLIFDEATSGLDVLVARALLQAVRELREAGKCILFSTHNMSEVEKLCDRLAILHRGQLLAEGTLEDLRAQHEQHDLEELFFALISRSSEPAESA